MAVAPEMTWLLVITSPAVEMIIPVPWSSDDPLNRPPLPVPGPLASIDTTSGRTLFTMVGICAPPASAGPGVSSPTFTDGEELPLPPVPTASAMPAPAAPPMRAATTATTIHPRAPRGPDPETDSGVTPEGAPGTPAGFGGLPAGHPGTTGGSGALHTGVVSAGGATGGPAPYCGAAAADDSDSPGATAPGDVPPRAGGGAGTDRASSAPWS